MSKVTTRFRAFLGQAPHWVELLAQVPAEHVLRHDTVHPAFHGCIDWHSACHATWALLAHRRLTGDAKYAPIVDQILMPLKLAAEEADLKQRPDFEMPYGRAWFLRLALEDRIITGSTRCGPMGKAMADSLVARYRAKAPDPFAREYANPAWALTNLLDFARVDKKPEYEAFVKSIVAKRFLPALGKLPKPSAEAEWSDFMAVTPMLCEIVVRAGAMSGAALMKKVGARLLALKPVTEPERPHHYALNFSRAWALFALYEATEDERLLSLYLDHMEMSLSHPSWWRGDYRAVSHWVPQFGLFALQRAMENDKAVSS